MGKSLISITLLGFGILCLGFNYPAQADLESANYKIIGPTISSGGSEDLPSTNYKLQDIKGQGISGYRESSSYGLQLGGIYGELREGAAPTTEGWTEDPNVEKLRIRRSGNDIIVEWDRKSGYDGNFYVFCLKDRDFENDSTNWQFLMDTPLTSYVDTNQVGNVSTTGKVFYRVLSANNPSSLVNKVAVGKADVYLAASGLKLITCPFNDGVVSFIFPGQMASGSKYKLYPRSGTGLDVVTVTSAGVDGQDFAVAPTVGFWLRNESSDPAKITFCGSLEAPYQKDLAALDLTGNPLPAALESVSLGGETGDTFYHQAGSGLNPVVKTSAWTPYAFGVAEGMWYRTSSGSRYWNVNIRDNSGAIRSR